MKISSQLAQEIVDKVMKVIPYNVNIMDDTGLIVGSGDHERLGTYHTGAILAVENDRISIVYKTEDGTKPGVNIPIHFRNQIIGVIGISGDPDIVSPFAELVKITGELLVNQEFLYKEQRIKEQIKEEFLYQWIFHQDEYDGAFINRGESLGINLSLCRMAVIIKEGIEKEKILLDKQEFIFRLNTNTMLFIVPEQSDFLKRISGIVAQTDGKIGVGNCYPHIAKSVQEAKRAIEIAESLHLAEKYCFYRQLKFYDYLTQKEITFTDLDRFYQELEESPKGMELLETLLSYIENSGDMNLISKKLHIHRNSLAYRLQKIDHLSNRNPKNFTDLFQLFTGYVLYKMKKRG